MSRILHWLMAGMLLAMLFIGVSIVASLEHAFPPSMSRWEQRAASSSEKVLYTLMFALPLVGWGMLSAGHYPIAMFGTIHLPPILPAHPMLFAALRRAHTILAFLLFATFLAHLSAVLFHTLIVRDRRLDRMALWPIRSRKSERRR